MNMQSKSLLIAIAAFAVTASGVQAYGGAKMLNRAGLNKDQVEAVEEARELRAAGDRTAARNRLVEAGISEDTLQSMRRATVDTKNTIHETLMAGDYEAFKEVVADSPLADIVTSEEDFQQFREAHELHQKNGEGLAKRFFGGMGKGDIGEEGFGRELRRSHHPVMVDLSEEQREAFRVARQANDRATMQAILDEAGL